MATPTYIRECTECDCIMWDRAVHVRMDESHEYQCRNCAATHEIPFLEHKPTNGTENRIYRVNRDREGGIFVGTPSDETFEEFLDRDEVSVLEPA